MRLFSCRYLASLKVCKPQPRIRITHVTNANSLSIPVSVVYRSSHCVSPIKWWIVKNTIYNIIMNNIFNTMNNNNKQYCQYNLTTSPVLGFTFTQALSPCFVYFTSHKSQQLTVKSLMYGTCYLEAAAFNTVCTVHVKTNNHVTTSTARLASALSFVLSYCSAAR